MNNKEMRSINDNIYDMFSIEEMEQRLQTSAVLSWSCTSTGFTCNPICSTVGNNCSPIVNCSPVAGGAGSLDGPVML